MRIRLPIVIVLALAVLALLCVVATNRLRGASERAAAAEHELQRVADDARDILRLRNANETASLGAPPQDDLIARLNTALSEAGLPGSALRDIERVADRALGDGATAKSGFKRRDVRVVIDPVDPPGLGRLLDRWQRTEPLWTVTGIDLSARRGRIQPGAPRYTVRLQLSAAYAETDLEGPDQP